MNAKTNMVSIKSRASPSITAAIHSISVTSTRITGNSNISAAAKTAAKVATTNISRAAMSSKRARTASQRRKMAEPRVRALILSMATIVACLGIAKLAAAEHIKIGSLKTVGTGPIYIADAKGYFAAEGLDIEFVVFDSAQP